eukprot:CAMPEP_0198722568 /NCGR_PEP_ID=MMETSP1475-20131203/256_1 /TAXON_ID= ORGANISM="Unidentified sp., Strain CCMP1999" /NCGR_SAMPLE_ID=MMETSP1475 /ASSEMBLY_ACC=CAM_ASM_001111 /LENGTH=77 /DNA_ID=CAMNT_0044483481 /DNA_START=303 /DNA_END=533 /DNA_ORIENTATION=+
MTSTSRLDLGSGTLVTRYRYDSSIPGQFHSSESLRVSCRESPRVTDGSETHTPYAEFVAISPLSPNFLPKTTHRRPL